MAMVLHISFQRCSCAVTWTVDPMASIDLTLEHDGHDLSGSGWIRMQFIHGWIPGVSMKRRRIE